MFGVIIIHTHTHPPIHTHLRRVKLDSESVPFVRDLDNVLPLDELATLLVTVEVSVECYTPTAIAQHHGSAVPILRQCEWCELSGVCVNQTNSTRTNKQHAG